eukprot:5917207-Pyramimonas_sp.AAC.1
MCIRDSAHTATQCAASRSRAAAMRHKLCRIALSMLRDVQRPGLRYCTGVQRHAVQRTGACVHAYTCGSRHVCRWSCARWLS